MKCHRNKEHPLSIYIGTPSACNCITPVPNLYQASVACKDILNHWTPYLSEGQLALSSRVKDLYLNIRNSYPRE